MTGGTAPHAAGPAERSPGWQRELAGKRALVTGSSGGIGRHLALALAAAGADVAVHGRDDARTAAVAAEVERIGRRSLAVTGDLGGADAYRVSADVVGAVVAAWGGVDILVNNVGEYDFKPLEEHSADQFDRIMRGTVGTTFAASLAALPAMKAAGWGRIINLGAAGAERAGGFVHMGPHIAGKAAVISLTRTLAVEWGPFGITCNAVSPGIVDERELLRADAAGRRDRLAPVGRPGTSADIADAVLFVASPASHFVNGAVITVSGGWDAVHWEQGGG